MDLVELMYTRGEQTPNLLSFAEKLVNILSGNREESWRLPETATAYESYIEERGRCGVAADIRKKIGEGGVAICANDYPYDALMPVESALTHLCFWSLLLPLTRQFIDENLDGTEYADRAALVFVQLRHNRTVPEIPHAHVVVDNHSL